MKNFYKLLHDFSRFHAAVIHFLNHDEHTTLTAVDTRTLEVIEHCRYNILAIHFHAVDACGSC